MGRAQWSTANQLIPRRASKFGGWYVRRRSREIQHGRSLSGPGKRPSRSGAVVADAIVRAHLATFFANLPEEMAKAHLVIGRAGASTVAELTVMGRPSILVPLPHSIDNDQLQNANRLAESGGAWCIEQKELTPERLANALGRLLGSPQQLAEAAAAAKRQGRPDAVARLADLVEELVGRGEKTA